MNRARLEAAQALVKRGAFAEALPILDGVIADNPDDWNSVYLAGQCCRFTGNNARAIALLERASMIGPNQPGVWLALGIAQQLESSYYKSIESLNRAIELDNDSMAAHNSLAITYKLVGSLEKASNEFDEALNAISRSILPEWSTPEATRYLSMTSSQNWAIPCGLRPP